MSITYNSTTKIITVSGETNCNYQALYDASVAGGWNVIQKLDDVFIISARMDLTNSTTFYDRGKVIIFDGAALPNNELNEIWINVTSGTTLTLGQVSDATNKIGKNGCVLYFKNSPSTGYRSNVQNYGTIYLYGCTIKTGIDSSNSILLWREGKWVAWNTFFDGQSSIAFESMNNAANEFVNCIFNNINHWGSTMYMADSTIVEYAIEYGANNLVYRNCKIINSIMGLLRSTNRKIYVWDSTATNWTDISVSNKATNQVYRGYSVAPTILGINKSPIQGANIKLFDKNNNLVFDLNTDANGTITPQDVIENSWIAQGLAVNNYAVITNYNPFTLVVSKDGYETYTSTFDLTEKYRSIITLTPPEYIYVDKISVVENLNPKINDELLSCNIQQDIISATIKSEN